MEDVTQESMAEKRRLRMHPHMLMDIIKRQAGTLDKAIMEGVMNAVDAGAKSVRVGLTTDQLTIVDDGMGMTNKAQIEEVWETFGQPPTEEEKARKTYGQFRMGRGQLFAFGVNTWRTGTFRMTVDVNNKGDDWVLEEKQAPSEGCLIDVQLYEKLLPSRVAEIERNLVNALKYVPIVVELNGERVSIDATKEKWQHTTDEAYITLKDTGLLRIYNLGIIVQETSRFGVGGEVVSRKQLKVNFARNEVMADCPVWKAIRKVVDKRSEEKIRKQPALTDFARQRLIDEFIADPDHETATKAKLICDVTGRYWSMENIVATRYDRTISVAEIGNRRADKLMQHKLAFVVADKTLDEFHVPSVPKLLALIKEAVPAWSYFKYRPFDEISQRLTEHYEIIDPNDYTVLEECVMDTLRRSISSLHLFMHSNNDDEELINRIYRKLKLGKSDCADGWTDGGTNAHGGGGYIAIDRRFIKETGATMDAWAAYGCLLIHELCHNDSDQMTHTHGPEFYQQYHDWTAFSLSAFVRECLVNYPTVAKRVGAKLDKARLKDADIVAKTSRAEELLAGKFDEPVLPPKPVKATAKAKRK